MAVGQQGKARLIFPVVMACLMAIFMTCVVTFINVGFAPDFFARWGKAFLFAWPLASVAVFVASPMAHRITAWLVARF